MSLYLPGLNAVFIHIPKTGGSWVKEVLSKSMKVEPAIGAGSHNLPWRYNHPGAKRFCFVRDPVTWLESVWMGLHSSWPHEGRGLDVPEMLNDRAFSPIRLLTMRCGERDFDTFIDNVLELEPGFVSRMYEWYIGPQGAPLVDFVGRMESIVADLSNALFHMGWDGDIEFTDPVNSCESARPNWDGRLKNDIISAERVGLQRWYGSTG